MKNRQESTNLNIVIFLSCFTLTNKFNLNIIFDFFILYILIYK